MAADAPERRGEGFPRRRQPWYKETALRLRCINRSRWTKRGMKDRRYSIRKAVNVPAAFRILREGTDLAEMRLTGIAHGQIRDLGMHGLALDTAHVVVDGLRLDSITNWQIKARVFLQWEVLGSPKVGVVAEPAWCEPVTRGTQQMLHVGMRFREFTLGAREAIKALLATP